MLYNSNNNKNRNTMKTKIQLDTERLDKFVQEKIDRLLAIENFKKERLEIIKSAMPQIEDWANKLGCTEIKLGNMYSSHMGEQEYTEDANLIVHADLNLNKVPANVELFKKRSGEKFKLEVTTNHPNIHYRWSSLFICSNILKVEFHISGGNK